MKFFRPGFRITQLDALLIQPPNICSFPTIFLLPKAEIIRAAAEHKPTYTGNATAIVVRAKSQKDKERPSHKEKSPVEAPVEAPVVVSLPRNNAPRQSAPSAT
jgi:hypothetical protein